MTTLDSPGAPVGVRGALHRIASRLREWRADASHRTIAQRAAGTAFVIRVASAAIIYLGQVLLARWMGRFEFGIYVYVWAWVGFLGMPAALGLAYSAQRFIPEYRTLGDTDRLRGFLRRSRWMCFGLGSAAGTLLAGAVVVFSGEIAPYYFLPFIVASLALPVFPLSSAQDSIGRAFNWIDLALIPGFIVHPLMIFAAMAAVHFYGVPVTALHALIAATAAFWVVVLAQVVLLGRRLKRDVPPGARRYETKVWLKTSFPIFLVDGFFILLTSVDVLILQAFVGPADIAVYYAATKTLVLISFVYFAVSAASAHRFSEYHVAGEQEKLARFVSEMIRWTFWPSFALAIVLLAVGEPILSLFGPGFEEGYPLIFVMVIGLVARASIGPSERLLNMVGQQSACAFVYACAFVVNLVLCLLLIPHFGLIGAAWSTASAIVCESALLYVITKRRLGLHIFIVGH